MIMIMIMIRRRARSPVRYKAEQPEGTPEHRAVLPAGALPCPSRSRCLTRSPGRGARCPGGSPPGDAGSNSSPLGGVHPGTLVLVGVHRSGCFGRQSQPENSSVLHRLQQHRVHSAVSGIRTLRIGGLDSRVQRHGSGIQDRELSGGRAGIEPFAGNDPGDLSGSPRLSRNRCSNS